MKLLLMRHAEAEAGSGGPDEDRALNEQGRADLRRMATLIAACEWKLLRIRHSPLLRAAQTATGLGQHLSELQGRSPIVEVDPRLRPDAGPEQFADVFADDSGEGCSLWVFHAPDVMQAAAWFTGGRDSSFYFTPGSVLALNTPGPNPVGRAMIVWQAQPEYVRRLLIPSPP